MLYLPLIKVSTLNWPSVVYLHSTIVCNGANEMVSFSVTKVWSGVALQLATVDVRHVKDRDNSETETCPQGRTASDGTRGLCARTSSSST